MTEYMGIKVESVIVKNTESEYIPQLGDIKEIRIMYQEDTIGFVPSLIKHCKNLETLYIYCTLTNEGKQCIV